jgi:hypothetical protein
MLPCIKVGDHVVPPRVHRFGDHQWRRRYDILAVEPSTRFGKPDLLLNVRITAIDIHSGKEQVTDANVRRWLDQIV